MARQCLRVLLIVLIFIVVVVHRPGLKRSQPFAVPRVKSKGGVPGGAVPGGATGFRFSGDRVREYHAPVGRNPINQKTFHQHHNGFGDECTKFAVVTTVNKPTESVRRVSSLKSWCLIIVGDTKTPDDDYTKFADENANVLYLPISTQQDMSNYNLFFSKIPLNSFARKNVGYFYAIFLGARVLYDFDDDNLLLSPENGSTILDPFWYRDELSLQRSVLLRYSSEEDEVEPEGSQELPVWQIPFNPYPHMRPSYNYSWPRGFPIDQLRANFDHVPHHVMNAGSIKYQAIGVIQSLCNDDPDVDAIFRMTRYHSTNFTFDNSFTALPQLIPRKSYSPYNAQATTHFYSAFWGLFLPITVSGRVSDIWRSYITQRIMKDIGLYVVYNPPQVVHHRSNHDYLSDLSAEDYLYERTSALLLFLTRWNSSQLSLKTRILELWTALYERDYIEEADVEAVGLWLEALTEVGYVFPIVNETQLPRPVAQPEIDHQPFRARPYFNVNNDGLAWFEMPRHDSGMWSEWLQSSLSTPRPPDAVVKLIMMTRNEYPLVESWIFYHGNLIGFHNLYIIDSSTDPAAISFLRSARDLYGANVLFLDIDLNQLTSVMTKIGAEVSGSSDFILKVDTDEFLVVFNSSGLTADIGVKKYLKDFGLDAGHPLRQLIGQHGTVSYEQGSISDRDVCAEKGLNARPYEFQLDPTVSRQTGYKKVFDARLVGTSVEVNLGGHGGGLPTKFGILHYHNRCIESEVANSKQAVERHNYLDVHDSNEAAIEKLSRRCHCEPTSDLCDTCVTCSGNSYHKVKFYLNWLACPEKMEAKFYSGLEGVSNEAFRSFLVAALDEFRLVEMTG